MQLFNPDYKSSSSPLPSYPKHYNQQKNIVKWLGEMGSERINFPDWMQCSALRSHNTPSVPRPLENRHNLHHSLVFTTTLHNWLCNIITLSLSGWGGGGGWWGREQKRASEYRMNMEILPLCSQNYHLIRPNTHTNTSPDVQVFVFGMEIRIFTQKQEGGICVANYLASQLLNLMKWIN